MAAIQVNMRVPEVLLARINAVAGDERTKWILEACRMRLDGVAGIDKSAVSKGTTGSQTLDTGTNVKSPAEAKEPQTPPKPDMQALRDICAGKVSTQVAGVGVLEREEHVPTTTVPAEIPICGKNWWEDGDQYECLMDAGHREQKHGMRGMVRRLDA